MSSARLAGTTATRWRTGPPGPFAAPLSGRPASITTAVARSTAERREHD
ncbi:hypothetical protein ACIPJG_31410 [Streptomyces halstedii]